MKITRNQDGDIVIPVHLMREILNNIPDHEALDECRRMVEERISVFPVYINNYSLGKKMGDSDLIWTPKDVRDVYTALGQPVNEDLVGINTNFYIERNIRTDYAHLTISDDGVNNRPWRIDEIELINQALNNV